jgi:hypothetical protein
VKHPEIPRLIRTLRHLRSEQVAGRARRLLRSRAESIQTYASPPTLRLREAGISYLGSPAHASYHGPDRIRLINREVRFRDGIDWDFTGEGPLWVYHLHQFDWARCPELSPQDRLAAMLDWVERHPRGIGWDAGPISLRTFSWIKLLTTPGALPGDPQSRGAICASLASQLATLAKNLEVELLANHYLWNLLALVAAGAAFEGEDGDRWLAHESLLCDQLEEQVLSDGAHYERSPMYHSLLLENLLDLVNVVASTSGRRSEHLLSPLRAKAGRMLGALRVWTHPDGEIALFGDSAFGIAHEPAVLERYATALDVTAVPPASSGVLDKAGYVRLAEGPFTLIASVAGPMPNYQPGHAHCDALAFELSVGADRIVTDTGVAEYVPGELRDASRTTSGHATLQLDGEEQAEIWAAHRVGGRPHVALISVDPGRRAEAVCSGWATPRVFHRRVFEVDEASVAIHDQLTGPAAPVRLHLPLAPGLAPRLDGSRAAIDLPRGGRLHIELPRGVHWRVSRIPYFPEFGRTIERQALLGEADSFASASWRFTFAEH